MKGYIKYLLVLIFFNCTNDLGKNLTVSGNIKGLRKGKLYLQKYINDTTLFNIDSLKKDETDTTLQKIPFFAEKGKIEINTRLNTFLSSAKVDGSENQILWDEYLMVMRKFNNRNIELVKDYLEKKGEFSSKQRDELFEKKNSLINRKKILFSLNFAMNNSDKEISAYIGLYELNNISKKYLDSLYSKLNIEIKNSFYGKKLKLKLENSI